SKPVRILPSGRIFNEVEYPNKRGQKQTPSHFAEREDIRRSQISAQARAKASPFAFIPAYPYLYRKIPSR
ncbi:MAG: hypothetical protein K2N93_01060, partial [Alistipes sp.]|nr:hypothetical protein [Alistipes sp.]